MNHELTSKSFGQTIELVKVLIDIIKSEDCTCDCSISTKNAKYLLNQVLRQIELSHQKCYISKNAETLWSSITEQSILDYWYQSKVVNSLSDNISIKIYKGASSKSTEERLLKKGDSFKYREVFHDDHIIPINVIINQLLKLDQVDDESIMAIISKISICKMLKEEDREIRERCNRPFSENAVIDDIYLPNGILVKAIIR